MKQKILRQILSQILLNHAQVYFVKNLTTCQVTFFTFRKSLKKSPFQIREKRKSTFLRQVSYTTPTNSTQDM